MPEFENLQKLIFELTAETGTPGDEWAAAAVAKTKLEEFMPAKIDALGSVRGELAGTGIHILLDAHIDQIGMIVTAVDDNGFLKVDKCGGMDIRVLAAHEVMVWGVKPVYGIVTSTPPHLSKKDDDAKARGFEDIAIDVGLSKETASELIRPGDRVTLKGGQRRLMGNRICSPGLDDRAGVASILRCLEKIKDKKHSCRISVIFSVQEETGGSGAGTSGYSAAADEAIAVDVSFAMAPGMPREKCSDIGKGPMIGISPTLDYSMGKTLENIAKSKNIAFQLEIMGGRTGTNADEIQVAGSGTKTALLSIPLKNMHTSVELADLEDIENLATLMAEYILKRGGDYE